MFLRLVIFAFNCVVIVTCQILPQQNDSSCCASEMLQLKNRTEFLEVKLNAEIAKREKLEREIQLKNDLTQFLQRDVLRLNVTLNEERASRLHLDTRLQGLEQTLCGLQSTLGEDREARAQIASDVKLLENRLASDISAVITSVMSMNQTVLVVHSDTTKLQTELFQLGGRSSSMLNDLFNITGMVNHLNTVIPKTVSQQQGLIQNVSKQQSSLLSQQQTLNNLKTQIQILQTSFVTLSNVTAQSNTTSPDKQEILFSATGASATSNLQTFAPVFRKVITNIGHAFDATKSLFTCPIKGNYFITATIQKEEENVSLQCWIRRNGSPLMLIKALDTFPGTPASASNSVILNLNPGDRIELSQCSGDSGFLPEGTSFSGTLL